MARRCPITQLQTFCFTQQWRNDFAAPHRDQYTGDVGIRRGSATRLSAAGACAGKS